MRTLLKILLFPFSLILTLVVYVCAFLVGGFGIVLKIISGLLFLIAVVMCGFALFNDSYDWMPAIVSGIAAFLLSPYGLPKLAEWLVIKLAELNGAIKSI